MANERPKFNSAAVIGAAGQIGQLMIESLAPTTDLVGVVRNTRPEFPNGVRASTSIAEALSQGPEIVILTTPNPLNGVLKEITEAAKKPTVLAVTTNGIVLPKLQEAAEANSNLHIVRTPVFTTVVRNESGGVVHGEKRIALAGDRNVGVGEMDKVQELFERGGFNTLVLPDAKALEWTKLLANLVGTTANVTGLGPGETFNDAVLYGYEQRAIRDRLAILRAAGIVPADISWVSQINLIPIVPSLGRGIVASKVAKGRNNQPPAAAVQIKNGARRVEASGEYHRPLIALGAEQNPPLRSPVDEAIFDTLMWHQKTGELTGMKPEDRKALFEEAVNLETKPVYTEISPVINWVTETWTRAMIRSSRVSGQGYAQTILESLSRGRSAIIAPNHLSHADHPVLIMALKEMMGSEFDKYPLTIVAGMKFRNDPITKALDRGYSNVTLWTLEEGREEERWKAEIVNSRAREELDSRLGKPGFVVIYYEGGRSSDGTLKKAKPGASLAAVNPNVELVVPVAIQGTNQILHPTQKFPTFGKVSVEIGEPLRAEELIAATNDLPRDQRDARRSEMVMERIAEMLPRGQRGYYSLNS